MWLLLCIASIALLGVAIILLLAFFFFLKSCKLRKGEEFSHDREYSPSPTKPAFEETELVFFVEKEEWFELEELLEGEADLRSQGFYNSLYTVQLKNNAIYAVKRLKKLNVCFEEFGVTMRRIGKFRHPNLLPLVSYYSTHHQKLLIYAFQTNGSLLDLFQKYVEGKRTFPWKLRLSIAVGIARGLEFIHQNHDDGIENIPHGCIKLSNIMLNDNEEPLISEYGYTHFVDPTLASLSMKGYMSPEKTLSRESDVYSFGVIMLELLTGKIVENCGFDLPRWVMSELSEQVFDIDISNETTYAFPLLNVSLKCMANQPQDRPTIDEVVEKIEEVVNAMYI